MQAHTDALVDVYYFRSTAGLAMTSRVLPLVMSAPSLSSRLRSLWLPGSGSAQLEAAERRVLSRVSVPFRQTLVPIGQGQLINTLHIAPQQHSKPVGSSSGSGEVSSVLPPVSSAPPLVLLHGFGAGIGLWYGNLDALSSLPAAATTSPARSSAPSIAPSPCDVYAVDMLGCGRSSRPAFTARTTEQAEEFFVESLDRWRAANGIERMCLAGHSFGGYMAAAYAMKFPQRVSRLILLSPVGVPQQPPDYQRRTESMPTAQRALFGFVNTLWQRGVTPNQFIRVRLAPPSSQARSSRYVQI